MMPRRVWLPLLLALALLRAGPARAEPETAGDEARALVVDARRLREQGRLEEARAAYARWTELRPDQTEPWFWLGTLDRWAGRDAPALESYTRALALDPCHLDSLKGRARVYRHQDRIDRAEGDLRAALVCRPADEEASEQLAALLEARGDRSGAELLLREAFLGAELDEKLGDLALSAGHPAQAAEHYARALVDEPEDASLHRKLADAERERGHGAAALESYREAARIDPQDTGSLYWIGVLATREGRSEEALAAYDRMLARKPEDGGALVGKARLLHRDGRDAEALALLDRALGASPDSGEARLLRASILEAGNEPERARADYLSVIAGEPESADAWRGLDRLAARRSWGAAASYDRSEVLEGLEDQGLQTDTGETIVPARVEYLNEGASGSLRWPSGEHSDLVGELSTRREAVRLVGGGTIYDFDVVELLAGMDHRLSPALEVYWRVGGTRYASRFSNTIPDESHFTGRAGLTWQGAENRISAHVASDSFIWRGFAGDTDFRIFTRNRIWSDWAHDLAHGFSVGAGAGVADFDDGNTVPSFSGWLGWSQGARSATLRLRHDPFPARFLTDPDRRLDFVDYDAASLTGRTPLWFGIELSGELLAARFGETPRTIEVDTDVPPDGIPNRVDGPLERNSERLMRLRLAWSPERHEQLTTGVEYLSDHFSFDTGKYNNNNLHSWSLFAEYADDVGPRWHYALRYAHGFIGDERDPSYGSNSYFAALDARLGRLDRSPGTPRLGVELLRRDNSLPEDGQRYRFYLAYPF